MTELLKAGSDTPRHRLTASDVLDLHADLHRTMWRIPRDHDERRMMMRYGMEDIAGRPEWAASHLSPATSLNDLTPWLESLSTDLISAATYQVTAEMTDLALALQANAPPMTELHDEELPSPAGFIWLDKPVPRPSVDDNGRPPLLMHAISWMRVPDHHVMIDLGSEDKVLETVMPAVRIRHWGWTNDPEVRPRPLYLMGQMTTPTAFGVRTSAETNAFTHLLWSLMGMEITTSERVEPSRACRKRASSLDQKRVTIVYLRRKAKARQNADEPKSIDWSCTWFVKGHPRKAPHGGTFKDGRERTWVRPYIKGPDGLPLKASDILYKLSR